MLIHIGIKRLAALALMRNFVAIDRTLVRATQSWPLKGHIHVAKDMLSEIAKAMLCLVSILIRKR